jgi:hypothetical protein
MCKNAKKVSRLVVRDVSRPVPLGAFLGLGAGEIMPLGPGRFWVCFRADERLSVHPQLSPFSPRLTPAYSIPVLVARALPLAQAGGGGVSLAPH